MDIQQRQGKLKSFYQDSYRAGKSNSKYCDLYGVSNSAQVIDRGIQIGNVNLNALSESTDYFIFSCVFKLPPEDAIYFAVHVESESSLLTETLEEMKSRDGQDFPSEKYKFNDNNKNVKIALGLDGRLYLRNIGQWESLSIDFSKIGGKVAQGIKVDKITVAVYPPTPSARRSLGVSEFIGFLGKVVGKNNIHDVLPWPEESHVSAEMQRLPHTLSLTDIRADIEHLGGYYNDDLIERFHTGLNYLSSKHFVILGGISGTGKTSLVLQYARAVHGLRSMEDKDPFLFMCPVRPEWTDPSGLTGYHDVLTDRYVVPTFLKAVLVAASNPLSPVFVCLDEMNLARVEYYFSDILSCMETEGGELSLHSSAVPLEASTGGDVCSEIPLPKNLYIIGTINVDETTNALSDKVLDRAVYIDMSKVDLSAFNNKLMLNEPELTTSVETCGRLLEKIHAILEPHKQGFGYRMAEECVRFHHFSIDKLGRGSPKVTDELLIQKVLVKLRGSHYQSDMLEDLLTLLSGYGKATELLRTLQADLQEFGSFQNAR